ncbi:hypothetical protein V8B97DRAFT_718771 [Scleroderma yunnanense]
MRPWQLSLFLNVCHTDVQPLIFFHRLSSAQCRKKCSLRHSWQGTSKSLFHILTHLKMSWEPRFCCQSYPRHSVIPVTRRGSSLALLTFTRNTSQLAFGIYFTPDPIPHPMISGATTDHIGSEVLGISLSTCPISELKQGGGNIASGCRSDDEVQLLTPVTRSEFDIHLSEGALYFWANQPRISSLDGLWVLGRGVEPEARLVWRGLGTAQE